MKKFTIISWFAILAICAYCSQDFISVKKHQWRCKAKNTQQGNHHQNNQGDGDNDDPNLGNPAINEAPINNDHNTTNTHEVKCVCGKVCKGIRGIRSHQRSCRTIKGINKDILDNIERNRAENYEPDIDPETINDINENENPTLKAGVKLPRNENEWNEANAFFRASFSTM